MIQVDDFPEVRTQRLWHEMMARLTGTAVLVFDRDPVVEVAEGSALVENGTTVRCWWGVR